MRRDDPSIARGIDAIPAPALALLAAVAAGIALNTGLTATGGGSRMAMVLPVALAGAVALGWLAFCRFEAFVVALLLVRASLDALKLSGGGTGALDPASMVALLFLVAAALWIAIQRRHVLSRSPTPLAIALGFLLAAQVASVIGSRDPVTSILDAVRMASVAAMFLVLYRLFVSEPGRTNMVLFAVFGSAVVPVCLTLVGFLTGGGPVEEKGQFTRATATFQQSNTFSRYLMLLILMGVAIYRHVDRRWRLPLALLLSGCVASLILTYTRSGWLGAVAGLIVIGWLESRRLLGILLVAGFILVLVAAPVRDRFADLFSDESDVENVAETSNSLDWRFRFWSEVLPLANENPVTGIGLNMTAAMTEEEKQPHNDFLRAYVETGLLGLAAYLGFLGALVSLARRAIRRARPGIERGIAAGFAACVTAFILVSAVANVLGSVVVLWYFAAFAGAAAAIAYRRVPVEVEADLQ